MMLEATHATATVPRIPRQRLAAGRELLTFGVKEVESDATLREALRCNDQGEAGLRVLPHVKTGSLGIVEFMAASAPNWGESLKSIVKYARLLDPAADHSLSSDRGRAYLELRRRAPPARSGMDFCSGLVALAARSWLGTLNTFEFSFVHRPPHGVGAYLPVFGCAEVRFGCNRNLVTFDADLLDAPLRNSNGYLHDVLRQRADLALQALPPPESVADQVRHLLMELIPLAACEIRNAAQRLHMSHSTLTMRLAQEGVSYRELLEHTRYNLACHYLSTGKADIGEIAGMLGYSEVAAFSRAFRRWHGESPTHYRRGQRARAPVQPRDEGDARHGGAHKAWGKGR